VGAAIAAGSHAEKGICALFVQADKIIIPIRAFGISKPPSPYTPNLQDPYGKIRAIEIKSPASPSRLVRAVIIPALKDLDLW